MKGETLMDAIGALPEELLAAVEKKRAAKPDRWIPWSAAAACLCLLLTLPFAGGERLKNAQKAELEAPMENYPAADGVLEDFHNAGGPECAEPAVPKEHFLAIAVEVRDRYLLVEPLEDSWEHSAGRIQVAVPEAMDPREFAPGDLLRITYSGILRESSPAQAVDVTEIERLG